METECSVFMVLNRRIREGLAKKMAFGQRAEDEGAAMREKLWIEGGPSAEPSLPNTSSIYFTLRDHEVHH